MHSRFLMLTGIPDVQMDRQVISARYNRKEPHTEPDGSFL